MGGLTMPQKRSSGNKGLRFFRLRKVVTLVELALALYCSPRTVHRRLAQWGAINSYNQNGRYYTLPDIPKFDVDGLWRFQGAFFSRFGNLTQTFVQLVGNSPAGLTAGEVGQLLGLRPSSFLWAFRDHPEVKREKHRGLYVHFASDPVRYVQQRQRRSTMSTTTRLPSEVEAVAILVEKIKHPALCVEELSRRLRRKKLPVEPEMVRNLLARHGIAEKKTPRST
jgi:hypothetical protein